MKKLSELSNDTLLLITPDGLDGEVMSKEDFIQSSYYIDKDEVEVTVAEEVYVSFDLEKALRYIGEDEMHEGWLENVMDKLSTELIKQIEKTINDVLETEPSYYDGEKVDWLN